MVPLIERLDLELQSLFTNKADGKRHAVVRDRRTGKDQQIDEGQNYGELVVVAIEDDGITFKTRGGSSTRKVLFRKAAEDVLFFKPKPQ